MVWISHLLNVLMPKAVSATVKLDEYYGTKKYCYVKLTNLVNAVILNLLQCNTMLFQML